MADSGTRASTYDHLAFLEDEDAAALDEVRANLRRNAELYRAMASNDRARASWRALYAEKQSEDGHALPA